MTKTAYRDKGRLFLEGTYAARPTATEDLEGVYYWVTSGTTNLWRLYLVVDAAWTEIDFGSRFAAAVHTHPYSDLGHNHDDRYSLLGHEHEFPTYGARGQIGFEPVGSGVTAPTGLQAWRTFLPKIEVAGTVVSYTDIVVWCDDDGEPTSEVALTILRNGETLGELVLGPGVHYAPVEIDPSVEAEDGDEISLDCPETMNGCTGLGLAVSLERVASA